MKANRINRVSPDRTQIVPKIDNSPASKLNDFSDKNLEDWVDGRSVAVLSHGWHDSGITKWINVTRDVLLLNTNDSDWAVLVIDWTLEAASLVFYLFYFYLFYTTVHRMTYGTTYVIKVSFRYT